MSAAVYNLKIDQGSDFVIDLAVKESGSAQDLSGYSARAQLRSSRSAESVAASFTCTVLDPPTNGFIKMELTNSVSSALSAGRYYYDLEIFTGSDAIVKRLLQGEVTLSQEVTR